MYSPTKLFDDTFVETFLYFGKKLLSAIVYKFDTVLDPDQIYMDSTLLDVADR